MKHLTILKFLLFSLGSALLLSAVAFFIMRYVNESTTAGHRQELALNLAREIESKPLKESIQDYELFHSTSHGEIRTPIWVIDEDGKILAAAAKHRFPTRWSDIELPDEVHEFTLQYTFLSLAPEAICVRLTDDDKGYERFLIIQLPTKKNISLVWSTPFLLIFITVSTAVFIALTLTFFYLQSKSKEARRILNRLKQGDLQARFKIQRFDEIGSLMLDFNLMANEIEGLFNKVQSIEKSRRTLLQELSHDLRTPLTSLTTSFETLRAHLTEMSAEDRGKFFTMIDSDLHYFARLLEDLFFISDLDEPDMQRHWKALDLSAILQTETYNRSQNRKSLQWKTHIATSPAEIEADEHLLQRLLKNAFENAERFAKTSIEVSLVEEEKNWQISIVDDGPGISAEEMEKFGTRRNRRRAIGEKGTHFSLGLGSVIMKSIIELHQGSMEIHNKKNGGAGTELVFRIPKRVRGAEA